MDAQGAPGHQTPAREAHVDVSAGMPRQQFLLVSPELSTRLAVGITLTDQYLP